MRRIVLVLLLCGISNCAFAIDSDSETRTESDTLSSPRLNKLRDELRNNSKNALTAFWAEVQNGAPLEEPITGDAHHTMVTFLWRGDNDNTKSVSVFGGIPSENLAKPLRRLQETDVWFLTEVHASEARFQYVFQINGPKYIPWDFKQMMQVIERTPPQPDPLNPRKYAGWSFVELPDAPPQPWILKHEGPKGRILRDKITSATMNNEYSLNIYLPPGYDKDVTTCWLAIAFDGGFLEMETTLNNLSAARRVPPIVVVGVENKDRERELGCSDTFADFLATELVPWARKSFRVDNDASHTIIGGTSLGGKMATWCGLKHSNVFGKVLSQSGSFQTGARDDSAIEMWSGEASHMVTSEFLHSKLLPVEFYLEVGRYETTLPFSPLLEARRLRDVLVAKGYRVTYSEFVGGHNEVCWRGSLANGLMALTAERQ